MNHGSHSIALVMVSSSWQRRPSLLPALPKENCSEVSNAAHVLKGDSDLIN